MGQMTLAPIVRAIGGDLLAGGRRANVPGPGHSPRDRSVSLLLASGRVVIHCFAGEDWREVLADLRRRGLVDGDGRLAVVGSTTPSHHDEPSPAARVRVAQELWSAARDLAGTLSARHLARRGVVVPSCDELRHHPGVPAAVYAERGARRPALLAAIRDARGTLAGVELTYLAPDGDRARIRTPRKTIGSCPAGAAVRLAPAEPRLLVGEGVFTCLSASVVFGLPAWALLSTRNLRSWRPPDGLRSVLIAGDRGREGEAAASALAEVLGALGVGCEVELPPAPSGDWNEAVVAGAAGGGGGRA